MLDSLYIFIELNKSWYDKYVVYEEAYFYYEDKIRSNFTTTTNKINNFIVYLFSNKRIKNVTYEQEHIYYY